MDAWCIRCRGPLNDAGFCPRCTAQAAETPEPPRPQAAPPLERHLRVDPPRAKDADSREADSRDGDSRDSDSPARERESTPPPPPAASVFEDEPPSTPSSAGIRNRELNLSDYSRAKEAVQELIEHRRRGLGRIIGLAGLPRHGKTKLADRMRERAAERPGADLRYDKTERGHVNIYYIPGSREHHVLIDVAGEDFQALGDYGREVPALVRNFLWPVLQRLDGLLLLMALPIVWAGWNEQGTDGRREPTEGEAEEMRRAYRRMVDSHRMLLKYAVVARDLRRLKRALPQLELDEEKAPTRNQIDDAFQTAAQLRYPVVTAFSKSDLFAAQQARSGLYTPDVPGRRTPAPPPPLHPLDSDPLILGWLHFPELFDFMMQRVRFFKFDFVQALEDRAPRPNPNIATAADPDIATLVGAEGILDLITGHPWGFPGISTATAVRIDRRIHRARWNGALRQLAEA